jgi:hypothetical protein
MSTTQRRKTDKEKPTDEADELTGHLNRAQSAVEASYASTQTLHSQWRTQLLRMAYLVMVVTLHMAQAPSSTCITNIKVSMESAGRPTTFGTTPSPPIRLSQLSHSRFPLLLLLLLLLLFSAIQSGKS